MASSGTPPKALAARGLRLVLVTLCYNVAEAIVALWAGEAAGSIALVGFGLDSVIETAASGMLVWRLTREGSGRNPETADRAEGLARRFVGWTFLALAAYVVVQSVRSLARGAAAEESVVGMLLAMLSLAVMPLLAWRKWRVAEAMGSAALMAEAKETLACSYLSLCLLAGLALNALLGWWWADPVGAALMVPWLVREGIETTSEADASAG
jgi:divalent metal cation (Fe/Co/Zn/Cd) transporter